MRLPLLDGNDQTSFDKVQICKMVDTFLEKGFTYFDTAYMYHDYKSENIIRDVLTSRHPRDSYQLATKLPTMMLKTAEDMPRIFSQQLEKCGVEYFDYYLLHCLNKENYATANLLGAFEFTARLKDEGKVDQVGFSFHDSAELLDEILTAHPEMDFVQLQINYLDWESDSVQSRKCWEVAVKHSMPIIVMEPVKGGTLANVPPMARRLLKEREQELSVPSWAIRYAASCKNVFMVLSGMSNMEQLLDNTSYMEEFKPLTPEENELCMRVADIISNSVSIPCTACRYCTENCPQAIPIPDYFMLYNADRQQSAEPYDTQKKQYHALAKTNGRASDCIECRSCESHCPQHIEISKMLKHVSNAFE